MKRVAGSLCLLVALSSFGQSAGAAACIERCNGKIMDCSKKCTGDKCSNRCSDIATSCSKSCNDKDFARGSSQKVK